jgi:GNAT superfamily N-acetyltransferase
MIQAHRVEYKEIEAWRDLYRQEANCQIVHDSFLSRGLADPYLILVEGRRAGYGAVANRYDKGRLMEFYTLPYMREFALPMCRELLAVGQATQMEAQTNMPSMLTLLYDIATDIVEENILFHDAFTTSFVCPKGIFRQSTQEDAPAIFPHHSEPVGQWLLELKGTIVATGGFLCHYNPPYGDIYMEVAESERRKGYGSYLVQEVKRVCYEAGKRPAARCNPTNLASRRTLQRAGLLPCGRMLAGKVAAAG